MSGGPASTLTAVLVDDERHCTDVLKWMLEQYCPQIHVEGVFNDPAEALKFLLDRSTDILFLDIQMPVLNAFDLLRALGEDHGEVIFTTAYDEYAMRAIKHHALDYLLKPVEKDELIGAIAKVRVPGGVSSGAGRLHALMADSSVPGLRDRLVIPTRDGLEMVPFDEIVQVIADDNYSQVRLTSGKRILVSRTLKDVERDLPADRFLRVHQSHVVALSMIRRYVRGAGGYLMLGNGDEVNVSRTRKEELMARLGVR